MYRIPYSVIQYFVLSCGVGGGGALIRRGAYLIFLALKGALIRSGALICLFEAGR